MYDSLVIEVMSEDKCLQTKRMNWSRATSQDFKAKLILTRLCALSRKAAVSQSLESRILAFTYATISSIRPICNQSGDPELNAWGLLVFLIFPAREKNNPFYEEKEIIV